MKNILYMLFVATILVMSTPVFATSEYVTDPALLAQLNAPEKANEKYITDPALLAELNEGVNSKVIQQPINQQQSSMKNGYNREDILKELARREAVSNQQQQEKQSYEFNLYITNTLQIIIIFCLVACIIRRCYINNCIEKFILKLSNLSGWWRLIIALEILWITLYMPLFY